MTRRELAIQLAGLVSHDPSESLIAGFEDHDELMAIAATDMSAALAYVDDAIHAHLDLLLWELHTARPHVDAA